MSPARISRELRRNGPLHDAKRCDAALAQCLADLRRRRPSRTIPDTGWAEVRRLMEEMRWSPQEISNRLLRERGVRISHESIYQMLLRVKADGGDRYKLPPRHGKPRKRFGTGRARAKGGVPGRRDIDQRPKDADERSVIGRWEGDTMCGARHSGRFATVAERKSRFLVARTAKRKTKDEVGAALIAALMEHKGRCDSITFDNGLEFAGHAAVGAALDAATYFAAPYASYQRGTNEHLNGILRRFFPKGASLADVTEE